MQELQKILEEKNLENDEMRVHMEIQKDQGSGSTNVRSSDQERQVIIRNQHQMNEILWLVNSVAGDLNQVHSNPQGAAVTISKKLQQISKVAQNVQDESQDSFLNQSMKRPESSQSGQTSNNVQNVSKLSGFQNSVPEQRQMQFQNRPASGKPSQKALNLSSLMSTSNQS